MKIGNTSQSKIVGIGDVSMHTNVRSTMTLRYVRHFSYFRLNLIFGIALEREVNEEYFKNERCELIKMSLFIAKGNEHGTLYKAHVQIYIEVV